MSSPADTLSPRDEALLRRAIALAEEARARGQMPFGALVAGPHGAILAEGRNEGRPPQGDPTRHAEMVALAAAARAHTPEQLAAATLYTSAEPCCMCAGAAYWCNVGRVVYGLGEDRLLALTGSHPENPTFSLSCRRVFEHGQRPVVVVGPALEAEAARVHDGFWGR